MKKKFVLCLALVLTLAIAFCGCGKTKTFTSASKKTDDSASTEKAAQNDTPVSTGEHPQVLFTMENGGTFKMELYPEYAPKTVDNFLKLVGEGFYDGLTFHRVCDDFMAQGGDPMGTGNGGSDETIPGEFSANGFTQNTLSHQRGVVSMARATDPNSASSQFFICYADASLLDGNYAGFGKVIEGMDTVDDFLKVERVLGSDGTISSPVTPIVIASAKVVAQ